MRLGNKRHAMRLTCVTMALALNSMGCAVLAPLFGAREHPVEWPTPEQLAALPPVPSDEDEFNGQAVMAAAAAIQETTRLWSDQGLFEGCSTPALGLGAVVHAWKDSYYVTVTQRFDRCGGKRFRMLDWWESFMVSPEGRVLARQPHGF